MCGIAGIIQPKKGDKVALDMMLNRIVHRGPDDVGIFIDENVAIGMRRLSIIDVEGGKQPISSEDGSVIIVFNGEIYNFKELRNELLLNGHTFKTDTDTEAVLHLYEDKGEGVVNYLRGMFTFIIYDLKKEKIFVARDQFGIKPLYYMLEDGIVKAIASEIKSLLTVDGYIKEINDEAIYNYLSYQFNPLPETFFKNIYRLLPATYAIIDAKSGRIVKEKKYWEYAFNDDEGMQEVPGSKKLSGIIIDSICHHLISDVPVGAFLSGGIDSAIIVGAIRKVHPSGELKTFTIGSKEVNEFKQAREQANELKTTHTDILLDPDEYFASLKKIAWHFDEPVADPSAVALFFLAREASKHVKVVLSGEGADELFGGYGIYREPFSLAVFARIPRVLRSIILQATRLPFNLWGLNFLRRFQKKLEDRYIGNAQVFSETEARAIWRGKPFRRIGLERIYGDVIGRSDSEKMQYVDMHTWLPGDILAKADKMTMAHSLELRVPYLDKEVSRFAQTIPDKLKYFGGNSKYLLRKAAEGLVPITTQGRKKLGFPVPLAAWLRSRVNWHDELISNKFLAAKFDMSAIRILIDEHVKERKDNARKIFVFMMLAAWYDAYYGEDSI
jgi:asparagine synthase (glutamine-hydrolysing)